MTRRLLITLCLVSSLAGCGDDTNNGVSGDAPGAASSPKIETVDVKRENWPAKCPDGSQIMSAICYADPGRGLSASGPLFLRQDDGSLAVECMTGGSNVRLFCLGR